MSNNLLIRTQTNQMLENLSSESNIRETDFYIIVTYNFDHTCLLTQKNPNQTKQLLGSQHGSEQMVNDILSAIVKNNNWFWKGQRQQITFPAIKLH